MIYYGRMNAEDVKSSLQKLADPLRAKNSAWFFKTGPGQYGEGDQFIGVTVPDQRKIAAAYREMPLQEVGELLRSPIHEHRLTALIILVQQYRNGDRDEMPPEFGSCAHLVNQEHAIAMPCGMVSSVSS